MDDVPRVLSINFDEFAANKLFCFLQILLSKALQKSEFARKYKVDKIFFRMAKIRILNERIDK